MPDGDWSCPKCRRRAAKVEARAAARAARRANGDGGNGNDEDDEDDDEDDEEDDDDTPTPGIRQRLNKLHHRNKSICQVDEEGAVIQEFASQKAAARALGVSPTMISLLVRGITSGKNSGLRLRYAADVAASARPKNKEQLPSSSPPVSMVGADGAIAPAKRTKQQQHGRSRGRHPATRKMGSDRDRSRASGHPRPF